MVRDSKKKEEKPKESPFKKFLKKRAPVYLAVIAIVIIFIVPELTKGDLQSSLPQDLSDDERLVVDTLMSYKGPNDEGLSIMDAISNQISDNYPNEKIYDNKKTKVDVSVTKLEGEQYQVIFDFQSYKEDLHYDWNLNMQNGEIDGNDKDSKYIIDIVDFYD
ncbi:MAG: hypothetical protein ACO2Y5_01205 [Nitrosopumilaceae archaeon]